jgi:hypothetical protein
LARLHYYGIIQTLAAVYHICKEDHDMKIGLIIALIFIVIIAIIGISIWKKRKADKRRQEMANWAKSRNLSFHPGNDSGIDDRFRFLNCLQQGENRYGYNIMEGPIGNRKVCAFDYHYETHHTDSKGHRQTSHHYFSSVIVETDLPLKPLFIRTENFLDKIGQFVGIDDINFESTEFNKQFYVKSPNKKWAYDVVNQATMELLMNSCRFSLEFNGITVIAYQKSTFAPGYFEEALLLLTRMLDNLPDSVIQELKGRGK